MNRREFIAASAAVVAAPMAIVKAASTPESTDFLRIEKREILPDGTYTQTIVGRKTFRSRAEMEKFAVRVPPGYTQRWFECRIYPAAKPDFAVALFRANQESIAQAADRR